MTAVAGVTWSLCTCDDGRHSYPDLDVWDVDRGVAELVAAFIPASVPRHLLRRTAVVAVEVVHVDAADPDAPVGEVPPVLTLGRSARRYDQCDETCTTDCGHCKGAGRPVSLAGA
jgi:hypothetical protein